MHLLYKILKFFGFYKNREVEYKNSTVSIVITGVETSPVWNKCAGALHDCDTFKSIISKCSDNYDLIMLKDSQATVAAWKNAVANAVKKPLAIIFYSGHGGSDVSHVFGPALDEKDGINEFLCLYDQPLLDDEIWKIISQSTGRVFLIFDCCHSQTMFKTVASPSNNVDTISLDLLSKYDSRDISSDEFKLLCWSGCEDSKVSLGSARGGILTNTIEKYAKPGISYAQLWNQLKEDSTLTRLENIQMTEIGTSFKLDSFCR